MPTHNLASMVTAASPGATLQLSGTYELTQPLVVDRPLSLVGSTDGGARVTATFEGDAVTFAGPGPWTLDGVAFAIEPGMGYAGVRVTSGQFTARGCAFTGAAQRVDRTTGAGLGAWGDARLLLDDCEFSRNRTGLQVEGAIDCEVGKCRFANNDWAGVHARESARIAVADCLFDANEHCGILLHDDCTARLTGNHVHDSGYYGVQASHCVRADMIGNHCDHNEGAGILITGTASCVLRNNRCNHNNQFGIVVQDAAAAELIGNAADANLAHGFVVITSDAATLCDNGARGNGAFGVAVFGRSQCTLLRNKLNDNGEVGLVFKDAVTGVARENDCQGNRHYAIWIDAGASVELADNLGEAVEGVDGPSAK